MIIPFEHEIVLMFCGVLGQLARVTVGLKKAFEAGVDFDPKRFFLSLITGSILGGVYGLMTGSFKDAFFAGYAGSDWFEGMYTPPSK